MFQATVQKYYDFYDYLKRTKLLKKLELFLFKLLTESCTDEEYALRVLRQCFGGTQTKDEDTTKITEETERSAEKTKALKEEMKTWMVRFLDAIDRSANHQLFVDDGLRDRGRLKSLLSQFSFLLRVPTFSRVREELGGVAPLETASSRAADERQEFAEAASCLPDMVDLAALETTFRETNKAFVKEYILDQLCREVSPPVEEESCAQDDNLVDAF